MLSRYPGLAASHIAPVMKILHTCISNGPPHPEELTILLQVSKLTYYSYFKILIESNLFQKFHDQLKQPPPTTVETSNENQLNDQLAILFKREGGLDFLITIILSYIPYDSLTKAKFG